MASEGRIKEKIETLTYINTIQNTADLETGTHTIVPTARPVIANAQYSKSLTIAAPSDARLVVLRIAARLSVNIAGLGTATHVYCSVRVDADDADHELFLEDWASIGAKLDAVDTTSAAKAVIFALLKDGAAHTFYFLFWADVASQATIDVVRLWEVVGSCSTANYPYSFCWGITHQGFLSLALLIFKEGTGIPGVLLSVNTTQGDPWVSAGSGHYTRYGVTNYLANNCALQTFGTVATDLNCLGILMINLRSEQ